MEKKEILSYLDLATTAIVSLTLFLLPLFFLLNTTDYFIFPKQILLIFATFALLVIWAAKMLVEKKIVAVVSPFNVPVILFAVIILVSSLFSSNRYDSLFQSIPVLITALFFFTLINGIKNKKTFNIALSSLLIGAVASSFLSLLYYLKIYILPIPLIQNQLFTTYGSSIQHVLYTLPILILSLGYLVRKFGFPKIKFSYEVIRKDGSLALHGASALILLAGIGLVVYEIVALPQKPIILPYLYGFQTAFASISQDASRFILSLLFGSGYGTFLTVFTRFKMAGFNLEQSIWNLNFSFSSSYFLELIATTGVLGALSFLFVFMRLLKTRTKVKNPIFAAAFLSFALSFFLPFSFVTSALLFILLAFYTIYLNLEEDKRIYEVSIGLVAFKKGFFSFEDADNRSEKVEGVVLPIAVSAVILILILFVGFYAVKFLDSDIKFSQSLQQANLNNGQKTYQLQTQAISEFPYRGDYHRIFSQVNLALANSLISSIPQGASPSAQVQQNVIALLQQSIGSARNAVTIAPLTSLNWQNLGQIYRNLINVGQNADQFAIASFNKAIELDQFNPQLYIQLGGIYFQLNQFEAAQNQFQISVNLKRDFANGYYNLGHAYEAKGDLQNALAAYQVVQQLSKDNKENLAKIDAEIDALQKKLGQVEAPNQAEKIEPGKNQPPLNISSPAAEFPPQKPPIKISPPPSEINVTPTPSATPTPTGATTTPTPSI